MTKNVRFIQSRFVLFQLLLFMLVISQVYGQTLTLPANFSRVQVASGMPKTTAMDIAPDGRVFICEQGGKLRVVKNGTLLSTAAVTLSNVDANYERGLIGVAVDPNFTTNKYIYLYYTVAAGTEKTNAFNRIVRYTMNGDVVNTSTRTVIFDLSDLLSGTRYHNGGSMVFGKDGKLYVGTGENQQGSTYSQSLDNTHGKILRMNPDGSIPTGNPFTGNAAKSRIWVYGLRNAFTFDINKTTGKIYVNDVGGALREEINDATTSGRNFGWAEKEGKCTSGCSGYTDPIYDYFRENETSNQTFRIDQGCAITGGTFFTPASTNYPSTYQGKYFFMDFCNNWINYIDPANTGAGIKNFGKGMGWHNVYLKVGADGNLYYLCRGTGSTNSNSILYKIVYSGGSAPTITQQPANVTATEGNTATFTVVASGSSTLTYQWRKNGNNISGATSATYTIATTQTSHAGTYSVVVSNSIGSATSSNATLTVTAPNASPTATITSPANNINYRGGDVFNYAGNASDPEDGTLPASAFTWDLVFHHNTHVHNDSDLPDGVKTGSFTTNNDHVDGDVWYELILTVTDSKGAVATASVRLNPVTSTLTLQTNPAGLQVRFDLQPRTTPYSSLVISNSPISIEAISPQVLNGVTYIFDSWSNGATTASQTITPGDNNATYTANYIVKPQTPYLGTVRNIPGKIEAEHFDEGGQGTAYNDLTTGNAGNALRTTENADIQATTDAGTGHNIGWAQAGEWLEYTVNVTTAGTYTLDARVAATATGKKLRVEMDGINISGSIAVPNTAGWQNWQTVSVTTTSLTTGQKIMRVFMETGDFNLNHLTFTSTGPVNESPSVSITSPLNNATFSAPADITINANAADTDGSVSNVEFYRGTTLIGSDNTSPYSVTWTGATAGTYSLTAKATDDKGAIKTSAAVNITVNAPPTCQAAAASADDGNVAANVLDGNLATRWSASGDPQWIQFCLETQQTVSGVEIAFFKGNERTSDFDVLISLDGNNWTTAASGLVSSGTSLNLQSFTFASSHNAKYVRIVGHGNNLNAWNSFTEVKIITGTPNTVPTVSITSPANNATFTESNTVTINANAADSDGTVAKVEFFVGTTKVGETTVSPYAVNWTATTGTHSLTAKATDDKGAATTSAAVSITVNEIPNEAPTVSITSPANNAAFDVGTTITIEASASDADGSITKVEFFRGTTKLGEDATSPYSFAWTNAAAGTYFLTAKATDDKGKTGTSAAVAITVNTVQGCEAAIASADDGNVAANVLDGNLATRWSASGDPQWIQFCLQTQQTVSGVEIAFFKGNERKASFDVQVSLNGTNWTTVASGLISSGTSLNLESFTFTAQNAKYVRIVGHGNNINLWNSFTEVKITTGTPNAAPTVSITSPANNATFTEGNTVTINADASDSDGSVVKVEFFRGTTKLGEDASSPYTITWTGVTPGTHSLTAKATDDKGGVATSAAVSVTVNALPNDAPTASITSPSNNAAFTAPASITINATAADSDGSVTKVEFYNGNTKLGEDATSPYSFSWTGVAGGNYSLTAKAIDNKGASGTSAAVTVTINALPAVSITSPANNASFTAPANISINASASDNGSVAKVEFFIGSTKLGEDATSPYSFAWNNVAAGTYSLTAKATDNLGAVKTSTAIGITVNSSNTCSGIPQYVENGGYVDGSKVQNAGNRYQCKPYPYTGWCNGASWAYAPGTGTAWQDAWTLLGSCSSARTSANTSATGIALIITAPNPVTHISTVTVSVETAGETSVIVFDNLGHEVVVLADEYLSEGTHIFNLDASKLPAGIYTCLMKNNGRIVSSIISKQ